MSNQDSDFKIGLVVVYIFLAVPCFFYKAFVLKTVWNWLVGIFQNVPTPSMFEVPEITIWIAIYILFFLKLIMPSSNFMISRIYEKIKADEDEKELMIFTFASPLSSFFSSTIILFICFLVK